MGSVMRSSYTYSPLRISGAFKLIFLTVSFWSCLLDVGVLAQSFELSDGDLVTCIPTLGQPGLEGQTTYNTIPRTAILDPSSTVFPSAGAQIAVQTYAEVTPCPDGTIPFRNGTTNAGPTAGGVNFYRKQPPPQDSNSTQTSHEYAIGYASNSMKVFKGTEVVMSVWDPYVESPTEFSLVQLWLAGGEYATNRLPMNTIEVGYQIYPGYGDRLARLFIFWTNDAYQSLKLCYDLNCGPGFVQLSNKVLMRGSFATVSTPGGQIYEIKIRVFQDDFTKDWWLQLNDEYVGYWPGALYALTANGLQSYANRVEWGGEIVNDFQDDGHHTKTDMGSGYEAIAKSAYMRNLKYVGSSSSLLASPFNLSVTNAACYSSEIGSTAAIPGWGSYFYFGGPGYGPNCL